MSRNQPLPSYATDLSGGVIFTVDGKGNIVPTDQQTVYRGVTILIQAAPMTTFSGQVCARQNDVCQCSALVEGVSSGNHMVLGTDYTVNSSVTIGSDFELYAVPDSGPVAGATNGEIHVGG